MKNLFLITCAILGCSFVIKAQHCPFDGANLIVIHLTDLDERPIKNAKISLQEIDNPNAESCSYSKGLLNKEFKPTESVLNSLYKMNNIAEKYCPDCSFLGEGFYAVSLNQAEETCMVKNGNDFKYQKRKFEIRYGDKKQIVEKEDIHSLCLSVGKWSRIKPIELAAKIDGETTKVPIIRQQKPLGQFHFRCYPLENRIVDKDLFEKIKEKKECSDMDSLKIDFSKQTLIFYRVGGDCHMTVTTDVFRNYEAKTYTVQINNLWGGCRAGGSFQGWLVIEKIPADYKIDFKEILIDGIREYENDKLFSGEGSKNPNAPSTESIESSEADLKDCIQMYQQNRFVIKTKEVYLKNIPNDTRKQSCVERAENLEFEKYSYIGLVINSGHCERPIGLEHEVTIDKTAKKYILKIKYIDGQGCRALSHYEYWVRVPKISENYTIDFRIEPKISDKEN